MKTRRLAIVLLSGALLLSGCLRRPVSLNVPFAAQSPFGNWDALHEEACEEMSLIMVHHYLAGTPLSAADAESEVKAMVDWETAHGYGVDVSTAQLGEIARALYGYHTRVLVNVSADTLRSELTLGHPVILPTSGRALQNPHFDGDIPFYHMLVVTGFTSNGFVTNEPGTKDGEKYGYSTNVLMNATHDWTGAKEQIETGPKNALVVEP